MSGRLNVDGSEYTVSFDDVFGEHRCTPQEREELVVYLAVYRAMKTIRALMPARPQAWTPAR